jgi:hypothetical protein
MVSKQNGSTPKAAPPPPGIPPEIAAALKAAGGTVGPIVPAVPLKEVTLTMPIERLNSMIDCMAGGPFAIVQSHILFIQEQTQRQAADLQKKANDAALAAAAAKKD